MRQRRKLWTRHRLSNHALRRLSQIVNGRPHNAGMALVALKDRELVEQIPGGGPFDLQATDEGRATLAQARAEGW